MWTAYESSLWGFTSWAVKVFLNCVWKWCFWSHGLYRIQTWCGLCCCVTARSSLVGIQLPTYALSVWSFQVLSAHAWVFPRCQHKVPCYSLNDSPLLIILLIVYLDNLYCLSAGCLHSLLLSPPAEELNKQTPAIEAWTLKKIDCHAPGPCIGYDYVILQHRLNTRLT